ncbi:hypothetical protein MMC14_009640 [Varicellaria rhodocarpa]|nr:hypothetical protein [Varicellaria rhodocarpa]
MQDLLHDLHVSPPASARAPCRTAQIQASVHERIWLWISTGFGKITTSITAGGQHILRWKSEADAGVRKTVRSQILGRHGEVLGIIVFSASTHDPIHAAQQGAQRTSLQQQQHQTTLQAPEIALSDIAQDDDGDSSSTDSSFSAIPEPAGTSEHPVVLQQALSHVAAADAAASQDSTALNAFVAHRRMLSKQGSGVPHLSSQDAALSSSQSDEHDAKSEAFLPSSSGV